RVLFRSFPYRRIRSAGFDPVRNSAPSLERKDDGRSVGYCLLRTGWLHLRGRCYSVSSEVSRTGVWGVRTMALARLLCASFLKNPRESIRVIKVMSAFILSKISLTASTFSGTCAISVDRSFTGVSFSSVAFHCCRRCRLSSVGPFFPSWICTNVQEGRILPNSESKLVRLLISPCW